MIEAEIRRETSFADISNLNWEVLWRPDLEPYFSRLGLCNKRYLDLYREQDHESEVSRGLVLIATDRMLPDETRVDEQRGLVDLCTAIAKEIDAEPDILGDPENGWDQLAYRFLGYAEVEPIDTKQITEYLTTAFTCAQYVSDTSIRTQFIEHVYQKGMDTALYDSIKDSGLNFIYGDMAIRYRMLSRVLKIKPADLPQLVAQLGIEHKAGDKPKILQKQLAAEYGTGTCPVETRAEANRASIPHPDRATFQPEPWKIERFALQQLFIEDQMRAMFPDGTTENSVLEESLKRLHAESPEEFTTATHLEEDLEIAIHSISTPVIEKYRLGDIAPESLTREQQLNGRFVRIHSLQTQFDELLRYLYPTEEILTRAESADIWSISHNGADIPGRVGMLIKTLRQRAVEYSESTGDLVSTPELHALANSKRKALLRLATKNIFELRAYRERGAFRSHNPEVISGQDKSEFAIKRSEKGQLQIDLPIEMPEFSTTDMRYNGATLGCVALRASFQSQSEDRRNDTNASNNYVDYILEIALKEANRRGLFDISSLLNKVPAEN